MPHETRGEIADGGAIPVQGDTASHHFDVLFLQTRGAAVFAGHGASVTGSSFDNNREITRE
jgi:hypothetical protein